MLNLIEEEADSFAKRAEMYYKRRPQLVDMIEDFYRAHRSLAEQYDQLKSGSAVRRSISVCPSFFDRSCSQSISSSDTDEGPKFSTDSFYSEESEVDDPVQEENEAESKPRVIMSDEGTDSYLVKLKHELERLREENTKLKDETAAKDEEKREVIRQLALSLDVLKEENVTLRRYIKHPEKKGGLFELKKLTKDDTMGPHREFARRFVEAIRKLAGNMPGDRWKKIVRLTARMLEAVRLVLGLGLACWSLRVVIIES
ncbi:hypothetical protein GW17_00028627 [Ensete ventricosum]|nr:hypothetical protein GW17_00028627 [Ensete ventricosum]